MICSQWMLHLCPYLDGEARRQSAELYMGMRMIMVLDNRTLGQGF